MDEFLKTKTKFLSWKIKYLVLIEYSMPHTMISSLSVQSDLAHK